MKVFEKENIAAVLLGKRNVEIIKVNDPELSPCQVRVGIHASAICGTQLGEWNMTRGADPYIPHCLGHEAVGRVLEVGAQVEGLRVGDRVVVSWMKTSGKSDGPPTFVDVSGAKINFGECCTFLRRGVFPENRVSKIDESIAVGSASLLGCALVTAYAAVKIATSGFTVLDSNIAIVGAGGIGMAVALLAKSHGLRATCIDLPKVVEKIDGDSSGLTLMSTKIAVASWVGEFPIVIICAGTASAFELAQLLLPKNFGVMVIVGNPPAGEKVHLDVKPLLYGREVIGVGEKDVSLPEDLYALVNLIKSGRLESESLIRRRFPLSNIQSALEITDLGLGGRTLIEVD